MVTKAIITTLDNLSILEQQIRILQNDLIGEIIVVNNGSLDGTREWLDVQSGVTVIHRENKGAGVGRNTGLDAAGVFDYVLLLDGGIRPLVGATQIMLDYLERYPEVDVISPEIATCFTTDPEKAHRRMVDPIDNSRCFPQRALSSTAYALCRYRAWDGIRFYTEGPFGKAGWGVDDNLMACDWNEAGILHHDFQGILVYRHASGSFARLFRDTGIWPNQYGSVYEQRNVLCSQLYPQYHDVIWLKGAIEVSVIMAVWNEYPTFAKEIKRIHDDLKDIPHEIIVVNNSSTDRTEWWLNTFSLRWPHGDTAIDSETEKILRRHEHPELSSVWTGNVIGIESENLGPGIAFNTAYDRAVGKYIFITDGDILPVRGSVKALYEYLDNHPEFDFVGINLHVCQEENEDPPFCGTFEGMPRYGLGNYAYGYSIFRRKLIDSGIRYPSTGPFRGPGCGYDDSDFACQMYEKGFNGWLFNKPRYYHKRRDLTRTGREGQDAERNLEERRRFLRVKWRDISYEMTHFHDQPQNRHRRRIAVVGKALNVLGDFGNAIANALEKICIVGRFVPGDEPEGWDDYLYVGSGDWNPPHALRHPSTFWISDMVFPWRWPHAQTERFVAAAKTHDRVFACQPSAAQHLQDEGMAAKWLPGAASVTLHKPHDVEKDLDWIALWHNCGPRPKLVEKLSEALPSGWVSWQGEGNYALQMSRARCSINLSRVGETNLRVFESMAIGVPLVTNRDAEGLTTLFQEGDHYLGYDDFDECVEQVLWVKGNPEKAQGMADRARAIVLQKHTFYHRVLEIFGT